MPPYGEEGDVPGERSADNSHVMPCENEEEELPAVALSGRAPHTSVLCGTSRLRCLHGTLCAYAGAGAMTAKDSKNRRTVDGNMGARTGAEDKVVQV